MAAQKGNDYARKWTEKKAIAFFNEVYDILSNDEKVHHISTALTKIEGAYIDLYSRLVEQFEVCRPIKSKIDTLIQSRLFENGLNSNNNAAITIFALKNMGWSDKQEISHSGTLETKRIVNDL